MIRHAGEQEVEVRHHMRGGPGDVTVRHYFRPEDFRARCRLCSRLTVAPGAGIGIHEHAKEDEVYIVLSGSGMLDDGKTRIRVGAGDAILTGNGESHAITNDGSQPLEIVAVILCY
jgi:mannose-6-phosphate isomerase-like protein (cupin superfamily)